MLTSDLLPQSVVLNAFQKVHKFDRSYFLFLIEDIKEEEVSIESSVNAPLVRVLDIYAKDKLVGYKIEIGKLKLHFPNMVMAALKAFDAYSYKDLKEQDMKLLYKLPEFNVFNHPLGCTMLISKQDQFRKRFE